MKAQLGKLKQGTGKTQVAAFCLLVSIFCLLSFAPQVFAACGGSDVTSGIVGWWKFDDGSGTSATDSSGNSNTGTLLAPLPTWTTGYFKGALNFNGTGSEVDVPHSASLNNLYLSGGLSVSTWVNASILDPTNYIDLVDKGNAGVGWSLDAYDSGQITFLSYNFATTSAERDSNAGVLPFGTWTNIVATWDGSATAANIHIYVNGTEVSYAATTNGVGTRGSDATTDMTIGACCDKINALMDDVRIYNRVLSSAEALSIYKAGTSGSVGDITYNSDFHVPQFCDGTRWWQMGQQGNGGGGCSSPSGSEGDMLYNSASHVPQFCDGAKWRAMGPQGTGGGSGCAPPGLIGWWKLDDGSGTAPVDSSGNGNTGAFVNTPAWVAGKINGALQFNGANDVTVGPATTLELSGSWTVAEWVNLSATPSSGNFYGLTAKDDGNGCTNYGLYIDNASAYFGGGGLGFAVGFNTAAGGCATTYNAKHVQAVSTGTWYHVAGVYDSVAQTLTLYVNGSNVASTNVTGDAPDGSDSGAYLYIGTEGGTQAFGTIDDVRVYNRALSSTEVSNLYNLVADVSYTEGDLIYNSSYNRVQFCNGTLWNDTGTR